MWIFTTIGFFSVTEMQEKPEVLQVRARVRGDLDLLRTKYLPELTKTVELKGRDYPYRAYTDRPCFSAAMVQIVHDLTYSNFKNEVDRVQGRPRELLYAKVWSVMYGAERKLEDEQKRLDEQRRLPVQTRFTDLSTDRIPRYTWDDWRREDDETGPGAGAGELVEEFDMMPESLLGDPELEDAVFHANEPEKKKARKRRRTSTRSR